MGPPSSLTCWCRLLPPFALTRAPDKHVGLEVCGGRVGDGSQDVVEGGITDCPDFVHCEQPGEKKHGVKHWPGV